MNQKGVGSYSYEDVRRRAQELGYALSDADDRLARQNPSAGMTILQYQKDYNDARSDAGRALAHQLAQNIRQQYGGYTAGADGSGYALDDKAPSDYVWNPEENAGYRQYRAAAQQQGQRASDDAMTQAAKRTGGIPSSYAVTAATQAGQAYASKIADAEESFRRQDRQEYLDNLKWHQANAENTAAAQQTERYRRAQLALQMKDYETLERLGFDTAVLRAAMGD